MTKFTAAQLELLEGLIEFTEDGFDVQGSVLGSVLGNVEGNVKGNVKGDVWGNVWGDVGGSVWGDVGNQGEQAMSDDLVKRLRTTWDADRSIISQTDNWMRERQDAADRIEELEEENHLLKTSGIIEVAVRNLNVAEYMWHWEGRAETAEAKLAKAARFIEHAVELGRWELNPSFRDEMIDFMTELKGQDDE